VILHDEAGSIFLDNKPGRREAASHVLPYKPNRTVASRFRSYGLAASGKIPGAGQPAGPTVDGMFDPVASKLRCSHG
jgi:hypothetical protein